MVVGWEVLFFLDTNWHEFFHEFHGVFLDRMVEEFFQSILTAKNAKSAKKEFWEDCFWFFFVLFVLFVVNWVGENGQNGI